MMFLLIEGSLERLKPIVGLAVFPDRLVTLSAKLYPMLNGVLC